ncbi:AAA family ATPase [Spirosoma montaniterrae]|uniref:AAA+ ATPase domain-containing protein n=1 Tax=Spirosoma montaniterrae TaxID=1178516 RepID=A0A1P9X0P4_9BACT|nr:AAA family ATPase [Spirosoma montaniterrae]AQG81207.1 hypothetical protein AWR27_18905 [Spirosoma montaniterrae]
MRLQELYIKDYKVLKDFTIRFDEQSAITVLIGENGSGKSTVLEAIAIIFNELSLDLDGKLKEQPLIEYSVVYVIWNRSPILNAPKGSEEIKQILVQLEYSYETGYKFLINKQPISQPEFKRQHLFRSLIPSKIFLYYSGLSTYLENLATGRNGLYSKELRSQKLNIGEYIYPKERLLYYISPLHHAITLLCQLLADEDGNPTTLTGKEVKAEYELNEVKIVIQKTTKFKSSESYERFWGAEGALANLMQILSLNTDLGRPDLPYGQQEKLDELTLSYTGLIGLRDIQYQNNLSNYEFAVVLFHLLESLFYEGYLAKVDLVFKRGHERLDYYRLSEGERHRYTILALAHLFNQSNEENNLFLLDEPDAYFHPRWQVKFIRAIQTEVNPFNQYIMATHSPLLLNYADRRHVHVQQLVDGQAVDYMPRYAGRDIATVLYELMGVEERPEGVRTQLTKLFSLIEDENTVDARALFAEIAAIIGHDDRDLTKAQAEIDFLEQLDETNNEE